MDFPFELLLAPGEDGSDVWLGLRSRFARVHGLTELAKIVDRKPNIKLGSRFVVGDPDMNDRKTRRLPAALMAAQEMTCLLQKAGIPAEQACEREATFSWLVSRFRRPDIAFLAFGGHGDIGTLFLADNSSLQLEDLKECKWYYCPFIHLDCCLAGTNFGHGGGLFVGFPAALLSSGAAAVLASFHPVYDEVAALFTLELYRALLSDDDSPGRDLGSALLHARKTIDRACGGNPLLWATSFLWGNPESRLR